MIKNDISVPIYNYIPVKRTYKGGANKYPYSAWSYGKRGFQVGSKGSSAESRAAAVKELTNNARLYSKLALTSCPTGPVPVSVDSGYVGHEGISGVCWTCTRCLFSLASKLLRMSMVGRGVIVYIKSVI